MFLLGCFPTVGESSLVCHPVSDSPSLLCWVSRTYTRHCTLSSRTALHSSYLTFSTTCYSQSVFILGQPSFSDVRISINDRPPRPTHQRHLSIILIKRLIRTQRIRTSLTLRLDTRLKRIINRWFECSIRSNSQETDEEGRYKADIRRHNSNSSSNESRGENRQALDIKIEPLLEIVLPS